LGQCFASWLSCYAVIWAAIRIIGPVALPPD
jgi:hypothetical protein